MTRHHFTIDLEECFHASAFEAWYPPSRWESLPRRSPGVVDRLLPFLRDRGVRGTFFILGWLAEREPEMVKQIAAAGHEVASHGWAHRQVGALTQDQFRESIRRSKAELERLCGSEVVGYRAPSFSIVPGREWAFDTLLDEGYRYDSSVFPVYHPTYGDPDAPRDPYHLHRVAGRLLEVPPCTHRWGGRNLAAAGGAYFRFFPYWFVRGAFRAASARNQPGTFYLHPWELDPDQPRLDAPRRVRFRTYTGGHRTWSRLDRFLTEFEFAPIAENVLGLRS